MLPNPPNEKASSPSRPPSSLKTQWPLNSGRISRSTCAKLPQHLSPLPLALFLVFSLGLGIAILTSFLYTHKDPAGCTIPYMRTAVHFPRFDAVQSPFASKYNLYLYRQEIIHPTFFPLSGVPVLFIPGNAGSYRQARSLASEAGIYFQNLNSNQDKLGKLPLDFFTVHFNDEFSAFSGQTLLDQAHYVNDAVAYILSLYQSPWMASRDPYLPIPTSVILIGHSMGGIVARLMLTAPNYIPNSINTIITLSTPHARAPLSFDFQMVRIYQELNNYWRHSHSLTWATDNPIWHVTLVSIAGGSRDTTVPSDYASVRSIIPDSHGFTVFSSSIPFVWSGMDHLAITWCDQLRAVVVRALFDVLDIHRPSQTKPRNERIRAFRKRFLSGFEPIMESDRSLWLQDCPAVVTINQTDGTSREDNTTIYPLGHRLVLSRIEGHNSRVHLFPIPATSRNKILDPYFTLLTDQQLYSADTPASSLLSVVFCSLPSPGGSPAQDPSSFLFLNSSTRLTCKNSSIDAIPLPSSTIYSRHPFDLHPPPFSYLQYRMRDLVDYQYVAVIEHPAPSRLSGWAVAELIPRKSFEWVSDLSLTKIALSGLTVQLPASHHLVMTIIIPSIRSSLLAFTLKAEYSRMCNDSSAPMFAPFVRQFVPSIYESRYLVNIRSADVNMHGMAPFVTPQVFFPSDSSAPPLSSQLNPSSQLRYTDSSSSQYPPFSRSSSPSDSLSRGLGFQLWADPSCATPLQLTLHLDLVGSLGRLWMRFRTLFVTFPLTVAVTVVRIQMCEYNRSGNFPSFSPAMNAAIANTLPKLAAILCGVAAILAWLASIVGSRAASSWFRPTDFLVGSDDPALAILVPLFMIVSAGLCISLYWATLMLVYFIAILIGGLGGIFRFLFSYLRRIIKVSPHNVQICKLLPKFIIRTRVYQALQSTYHHPLTSAMFFLLASKTIPFQIGYIALCLMQLITCARALRISWATSSSHMKNRLNYNQALLMLMLWIVPISLPMLVVWVGNLGTPWSAPFSSHHNLLSLLPFVLLVEVNSSGSIVPPLGRKGSLTSSAILSVLAFASAIVGVSHAYILFYLSNIFAAWLSLTRLSNFTPRSPIIPIPC